jgi:PadR family transcriptional regulator PadR
LKGHLEMLLMATLEKTPAHGYLIVERLRERSDGEFDLSEGTIYPALYRLERDGRVTSTWSGTGRRRRVYKLTRLGKLELEQARREWRSFAAAVEAVAG